MIASVLPGTSGISQAQGLIKTRTLSGTEKEQLLTITRAAKEFLERTNPGGTGPRQKLHHGFVKPREARHDAMIYRLYREGRQKNRRETAARSSGLFSTMN